MSGEFVHSARLLPGPARKDLKDIYRVYMPLETLKAHGLKPGSLCQLQNLGREPAAAIAWDSPKIQRKVVQMSEPFMAMHGFKHENKVSIRAVQPVTLKDANTVTVLEIPSSPNAETVPTMEAPPSHDDECYWRGALETMLYLAETISAGLVLDSVRWREQTRTFKIVEIDGSMSGDTLWRFTSSPSSRSRAVIKAEPLANGFLHQPFTPSISSEGIAELNDELVAQLNQSLRAYSSQPRRPVRPVDARVRGILLHGPSGSGKSLISHKIESVGWGKVISINTVSLYSNASSAIKIIENAFRDVQEFQPSLVVIDHLETVPPGASSNTYSPIATALLNGFKSVRDKPVLVLGATSNPKALNDEPHLSKCFDLQLALPNPEAKARRNILKTMIEAPTYVSEETLDVIGDRTHGYVGGDLLNVVKHAVGAAEARTHALDIPLSEHPFCVMEDFDIALAIVPPSVMRDAYIKVPKVSWSDIGGGDHAKTALKQAVEWPLKKAEAMILRGLTPPKGLLLYGPPGCAKTLTAAALATSSGLNFLAVKGAELLSKYVGDSESALRGVFAKARRAKPSVIFFDEIDSIATKRPDQGDQGPQLVTTFLNELDGIEPLQGVFVLAATNKPEVLDDALLRPGRLTNAIYLGPPDYEARKQIILMRMAKMNVEHTAEDVEWLAGVSEGRSGAELVNMFEKAATMAMEEEEGSGTPVMTARRHLEKAAGQVPRIITPEMVRKYEVWDQSFRGS